MTTPYRTTLGDLISLFYEEYLHQYGGDAELASVATAVSINEILVAEAATSPTRGDPALSLEADAA
jgi:hypothetical protein